MQEATSPPIQSRAAKVQSGAARAAMLGISDGLVTNTALILGMAGAHAAPPVIRLAGMASLVAGAISMAIGEYLSMQAQRELLESILVIERQELHDNPERARRELTEIFVEQGVAPEHAVSASEDLAADPEKAMQVYARGKLGINPDELGSAYGAAFSSLGSFAIGAAAPLAAYFIWTGTQALMLSLVFSAVMAVVVGSYLAHVTNAKWYRVAFRQLALVAAAAGFTYVIGIVFDTAIA
jgi:VIT1/CCC1 family predicted Fe2+/Mn2+ transporter